MCESVEKYGRECAKRQDVNTKLVFIKKLMKEADFTLEQALKMSDVTKDQRDYVISQLQK